MAFTAAGCTARALYTDTGSNVWNLENATITATTPTGYAMYRGNFVLRGTTTTTGLTGGGAGVIDFRGGFAVAATLDPANFVGGDSVTLSGAPGPATGEVQTAAITYTTDGSDPALSTTAHVYTAPFPVSVGTVVKAAYVVRGLRGPLTTVTYDVDHEASPVVVAAVQSFDDVTVGIGTPTDRIPLPTTAQVTLADGRSKSEGVTWDTSHINPSRKASWTIEGTLQLQDGITNPESVRAQFIVHYAEVSIASLTFTPAGPMIAGQASATQGAVVATMSAAGGNGEKYTYALTDTDADNSFFTIDVSRP